MVASAVAVAGNLAQGNIQGAAIMAIGIVGLGVAAVAIKAAVKVATVVRAVNAGAEVASAAAKAASAVKIAESGTYSVYVGIDAAKTIRYVGITSRPTAARFTEHKASGTNRAGLDYIVLNGTGSLSKWGARVREQTEINRYGLMKNGGQLFNKINSIANMAKF
jgi:hypothetical protein